MKTIFTNYSILLICCLILSCKKQKKESVNNGVSFFPDNISMIDYEAAWSPDGKWITFAHQDSIESKNGIYIISVDGKECRLWHQGFFAETPSWSPDGKWIAFTYGAQIWKKKLNGDSLIMMTNAGRNFFPSWSPDGKWIAYDSNENSVNGMNFISKVSSEGLNRIRIGYDPKNGEVRMPFWADNGLIYHIKYILGNSSSEIFSFDSSGNNLKRLTNDNFSDSYPKYSIKNKILFSSQRNSFSKIWVMDEDGSNQRQLTKTNGYTGDWSPDGNRIVYTDTSLGNGRLWLMNADGSGAYQLTFEKNF